MTDKCEHKWHFFEESIDGCFCTKGCNGRLGRGRAEAMLNEHASLTEKVERYNKILGAYRRFAAFVLDFAINFGELRTTGEQNKQIRDLENTARLNTQAANDWTALLESEQ